MIQIKIDNQSNTPIYKQIIGIVSDFVKTGKLKLGDKLPSINEIAEINNIAKETVVKAFKTLQELGIISSIHGKGFYILSKHTGKKHNVFVLFDTLSAYKEVTFLNIKDTFGSYATLDIFFHHFNFKIFESIISEHIGKYTHYIILPFDNPRLTAVLNKLPANKLFLMDRYPKDYHNEYIGVYQDFEADIYSALTNIGDKIKKYKKTHLIFQNTITQLPLELLNGFERFCKDKKINYEITKEPFAKVVEKGEAYIVIDDEDLVKIITQSWQKKYKLGKDVGVISYNDTSLKKIVAEGISVISTDFALMGKSIAEMVLKNKKESIKNPSSFIDRGSF